MRVAMDADLRGLLTPGQAASFVERLGLPRPRRDLAGLSALVRAYLGRIPFQNITMLARPRRAPTLAEIAADVLAGQGGPCGVMNPFFATLLQRLGFDVCLLSGSMEQPDCHIALSVLIDHQAYWLDVGNGHPYLEPVALGDEAPRSAAGLTYRVRSLGEPGRFAVEHQFVPGGPWRCSYRFGLTPVPFCFFSAMIDRHYTAPGYGPFLGGLRIIRCPREGLHALRDRTLLVHDGVNATRRELADRAELLAVVDQYFGELQLPVPAALAALEGLGARLFSDGEAA